LSADSFDCCCYSQVVYVADYHQYVSWSHNCVVMYISILLYLQGLVKLNEETVVLVVRKEDVKLVQGVVNDSVSDYIGLIKEATGEDVTCDVTVNNKVFLPPAPKGDGARSWYVVNQNEISTFVCMYLCIYVSMYLCIYVSMYLCRCIRLTTISHITFKYFNDKKQRWWPEIDSCAWTHRMRQHFGQSSSSCVPEPYADHSLHPLWRQGVGVMQQVEIQVYSN
jgi:hypothetical protein